MKPRKTMRKKRGRVDNVMATDKKLADLLGRVRDENGRPRWGAGDLIAMDVKWFIWERRDDDARLLLENLDLCWRDNLWGYLERLPGCRPESPDFAVQILPLSMAEKVEAFENIVRQKDQLEEWLAYQWLRTGGYDLSLAPRAVALCCRYMWEWNRWHGRSDEFREWLREELGRVGFVADSSDEVTEDGLWPPFPALAAASLQIARLLLNLGRFEDVRRWLVGTTYLLFLSLDGNRYEPRMGFLEFALDPAARTAEIERRGEPGDSGEPWRLEQVRMLQLLASHKLKGEPPLEEARSIFTIYLDWTTDPSSGPFYHSTESMCLYVLLGRLLHPEMDPFDVIRLFSAP